MSNVALTTPAGPQVMNVLDRAARQAFVRQLRSIKGGTISLADQTGKSEFGPAGDLTASIRVHRSRLFRNAMFGGTLSIADSYLRRLGL